VISSDSLIPQNVAISRWLFVKYICNFEGVPKVGIGTEELCLFFCCCVFFALLNLNELVRARTCKKKTKKNFQTACQKQQPHRPSLRSRVPVRAWPYGKKNSNNHTGRSFTLVNDDWIGALCLSINAHKKSRNY